MSSLQVTIGEGHPGARVYWRGHRVHHGLFGAVLVAAGVVLMFSDRHDFPWCWHDEPHPLLRRYHRHPA